MTFQPSALSYGEDAAVSAPAESTGQGGSPDAYMDYIPLARKILGLGDAAKDAPSLRARIDSLQHGNGLQVALAIVASGVTPGPGARERALEKTQELLAVAEGRATQMDTRDTMYTLMAVGGVTLIFGLTAFVLVKTFKTAKTPRSPAGK